MKLIPDDTTLRKFVPNVMETLEGDATFFERLEPYLVTAQGWLESNLMEPCLIEAVVDRAQSPDEPLYHLPRTLVALMAWRDAVPSLDLIITANGLSAVETKNSKPASKAKVERLLQSLDSRIDRVALMLLGELLKMVQFHKGTVAERLGKTLFNDPHEIECIANQYNPNGKGNVIDRFFEVQESIGFAENAVAREWVSVPVMMKLRRFSMADHLKTPCADNTLLREEGESPYGDREEVPFTVSRVLECVKAGTYKLFGQMMSIGMANMDVRMPAVGWPDLEEAQNLIFSRGDLFPEFKGTMQRQFLLTKSFRNRKGGTAYFF